jgi:hypothetical protein
VDAAAAELRLRLRVEELLLAHRAGSPPAEVASALDALDAASGALVATGLLEPRRGAAVVAETVDALVARGAHWLEPQSPDLDVTRLYDAASGGGRPRLRRVVGVATTLASGTITSVELWSDRAVARVVDGAGRIAPSYVVGAAGVDDRRLDVRDGAGGVVSVDLSSGRLVREVPGTVVPASVARYLDALVLLEASAAMAAGAGVDDLNGARQRVAAAAGVVDPAEVDGALRRFDDRVADGAGGAPAESGPPLLLEVVPVAQRFFGGWLTSIEVWSDHWRAVLVGEPGAPRRRWTASSPPADGAAFAATPLDDGEVLRFTPALPLGWTTLVLEGHGAGEVLELEVAR